ncbi:hypothetical protein GCK32_012234 [Trichostrongylus colubriformis]|uniref:Uncharacterized protein n=1 Tax=Trichostrongylus colubriformis TaxID=6319 RepID=A0AAN8GCA3_TRICO
MRLGLTLSLVSAFQIFQQSVVNELHDVDRKSFAFSLASAAFPLGQFISTLFLACYPISAKQGLFADAWLLIIGSIVAVIPSWALMCVGRFLIGCGAGLGFVCSTIVLYDMVPYASRPAHFLALGISFAFATLVINCVPLINIPDTTTVIFASIVSAASGIAYLLLQPKSDVEKMTNSSSEEFSEVPSEFPSTLIYVLMTLNVSIGVPAILAFSKGVFEKFGLDPTMAASLSVAFPVVQIILIFILHKTLLNRRILIVGGYIVAVMIQAMLLLTSYYSYLPPEVEQFDRSSEQMTFSSRGRALMWVLATASTATFTWTMEEYGFTLCFVPYVVISAMFLAVLIRIYPQNGKEDT